MTEGIASGQEPLPQQARPGFLILARRTGERIVLTLPNGDEIVLIAVECKRDRMRLGIAAPPEIVIAREELLEG